MKASKRLKEYHKRQIIQREKKAFNQAKAKFKPTKAQRDSFVFVSKQGKPVKITSRAKGFLYYVDSRGRRHHETYGSKFAARRISDYDVNKFGRSAKATGGFLRRYNLRTFGRVLPVENPKGVSYGQVGKRITTALGKAFGMSRTKKQFRVDMVLHVGKKRIRTSVMMTSGQVREFAEGKNKGVQDMIWSAISNELAHENLVTTGSSQFMQRINKGKRKKSWKTHAGEVWGKAGYKQVNITKIEFKFSK